MKRVYIVTYDICDAGRLRRVFKTMKGFGQHLQLSVFRCTLSRLDYAMLTTNLTEIINANEDQVILFDLGATGDRPIKSSTFLGRPLPPAREGSQIV